MAINSVSITEQEQQIADFVLFDDSNIYTSYRLPSFTSADNANNFHTRISDIGDLSFTDILAAPNMPEELQLHVPSSKHFYSLGSQPMETELPIASSAPGYEPEPAYSYFGSSDIPRTVGPSYIDKPAPGVLIHPPTFPFAEPSGHAEYRSTPAASPATSVGRIFEGSGSGSEAGSARNSPFNPPVGVEDNFQDFAINSGFVGIDPSLVSNSPTELLASASPFDSPNWNAAQSQSPAPLPSGPSSPNLQRYPSQSGRLSPSIHHVSSRHVPYPSRRPSTGSVHSKKSVGSPTITSVEKEDFYAPTRDVGYIPSRSPSQRSTASVSESVVNFMGSTTGHSSGKEGKETLCPECHKCFRDLRAHQLTHLHERPEKCPIATCEYSKKGFARKYDCQRHTLTHYKGTMVCDFCPGSGSASEKSFNRADVFKRHLMAVHNVEQTPPNGRQKKLPKSGKSSYPDEYASGKCSTCSETFPTAQRFYEHLDECVLSKVVEDEPAAAANEHNLSQIKTEEIEASLSLNVVSREKDEEEDDDEDDDEEHGDIDGAEDDEDKDETYGVLSSKKHKSGRIPSTRFKSKTMRRTGSSNSR